MSHRIYLVVWVVLYGSDVEEAETIMPILAFLIGAGCRESFLAASCAR